QAKGNGDAEQIYGRIIDYAGLFPDKEMGVMLVSDMHRAIGHELFSIPQFANWAKDVADVMLFEV
ncbi:MAG: ATPase, partial [Gammaproteobacteria bacterium]|nr:ATPase [Gammaproteobacteria bacterium]